jgi:hypothetical protein
MDEYLDEVRQSAVHMNGLTETIYLGDCIREWTRALREEQELTRQQMREGLEHSKEVLAFQKSVLEGVND